MTKRMILDTRRGRVTLQKEKRAGQPPSFTVTIGEPQVIREFSSWRSLREFIEKVPELKGITKLKSLDRVNE